MATIQTGSGEGLSYTFKRVYGNKVTNLFARQQTTWNMFNKSNRKASIRPGGEGFYFSLRQADIESIGARAEGDYIPEPMRADGVQGYIKPALLYGSLRMSGLAIEAGKGNAQAFVNSLSDQTMSLYKSLVMDLNRQCHGDGHGKLGTVSTAATTQTDTTFTVAFDNDTGVRYLRKGMIVDTYASGGTVNSNACNLKIQSINHSTKVVTFESAGTDYRSYHPNATIRAYTNSDSQTIAASSQMVRQGARVDTSFATSETPREMVGMLGHFDNGSLLATYEGVTVANDPEFKAQMLTNSSVNREVSIDLMLLAMDAAAGRSGIRPNTIMMGLGQRRKYFGLLAPDIRFAPQKLQGGYESLTFAQDGAVNMVVDPVAQPNRMFFYPDGAIKKYTLTDLGWGGFDPNRMHWRADYDEATMYLRMYANLGCEQRNALVLLGDLTEPTTNW